MLSGRACRRAVFASVLIATSGSSPGIEPEPDGGKRTFPRSHTSVRVSYKDGMEYSPIASEARGIAAVAATDGLVACSFCPASGSGLAGGAGPSYPGSRWGGRKISRRERRVSAADAPRTPFQRFLANLMRWISCTIVVSDPPRARISANSARIAASRGVFSAAGEGEGEGGR